MTIQEAIKSGKRFRRTVYLDEDWVNQKNVYTLTKEAILADDWEIGKQEKTSWTMEEIEKAYCTMRGVFVQLEQIPLWSTFEKFLK